jgi:hypothetical protein
MEKEIYIFIATSIGALAAYVTSKITSGTQLAIAKEALNNSLHQRSERDFFGV